MLNAGAPPDPNDAFGSPWAPKLNIPPGAAPGALEVWPKANELDAVGAARVGCASPNLKAPPPPPPPRGAFEEAEKLNALLLLAGAAFVVDPPKEKVLFAELSPNGEEAVEGAPPPKTTGALVFVVDPPNAGAAPLADPPKTDDDCWLFPPVLPDPPKANAPEDAELLVVVLEPPPKANVLALGNSTLGFAAAPPPNANGDDELDV